MRVLLLVNPGARLGAAEEALPLEDRCSELFADHRDNVEVRVVPPECLTETARRALAEGFDVIAAAGGDGTVNALAGVLVDSGVAMGILPMGTLNHFARDLGLPLDLERAAGAIVRGTPRPVDVGEVNGRAFVNNISIGLYPHVVRHRDRQMERLGRGKWLAMLFAFVSVLRRYPTVSVRIALGNGVHQQTTPFLFVSNGRYETDLFQLGRRQGIDAGELCLYLTRHSGRWALVRLALRALFGLLEQEKDFNLVSVRELWIETHKQSLRAAMDGEVVTLVPPLYFRIRPGALRVMVAADSKA
jgi:diacylglycerol kinase family enzyme